MRIALAAASIAFAFVESGARADEPTASLRVDAPPACPNADAFWAAFAARATHAKRVESDAQWSMRVRALDEGGAFRAIIDIDHAGTTTSRDISDPSCETAMTALAVIAALTVEPAPPPRPPHTQPEIVEPVPRPPPAPSPPWHLRVGASAALTTVLSPAFSVGVVGWLDLSHDLARYFALRIRAGFHWASSLNIDVATASALVTSNLARLELGGPRVPIARGLEADLAVSFDAGSLVGEGRNLSAGHAESGAWFDAGTIARLRWELWRLTIEAGFGAIVPIYSPHFQFLPGPVVVFEPPTVGVLGELGVAIRLF